jgi:hypothetical protein
MDAMHYSAHTPAFRGSLAQSAMPDAPVIPDEAVAREGEVLRQLRIAVSSALLWAAKTVAPSGAPATDPSRVLS